MSHLDPEQLALLAMGEPVASEAERRHLAGCPACRSELTEMEYAALVARTTLQQGGLEDPPARVWDGISRELRLGGRVAEHGGSPREDRPPAAAAPVAGETRSSLRARRRRRPLRRLLTLAASLLLVGAVAAGAWIGIAASLAADPIATATLDALPDHPDAAGRAEIDGGRDGTRTLTVTLEGAAETDDYLEVWLIRGDGSALISLGVLDAASGSFAIPPEVDLAAYDVVDISFEPVDGDPGHSGDSVVRGSLSFS